MLLQYFLKKLGVGAKGTPRDRICRDLLIPENDQKFQEFVATSLSFRRHPP